VAAPPRELDELVEALATALDAARVPYALGGAVCLAAWGVPRATRDVDLNVFVDESGLDAVFAALAAAGCDVDRVASRASAAERGDFQASAGGTRVDVFIAFHAYHVEVAARCVTVTAPAGRSLRLLSAEDLLVFKTLFGRTKDFADIERLVAARGSALDAAYVLRWLAALLPVDDPRPARVRALLGSGGASTG
jgi:hypothetical protein